MTEKNLKNFLPAARFLLSELIVAMAIGILMTGVIAAFYINMRGTFRYQEDLARIQESGRFAIDMMARDIRMAGYNGCGTITDFANTINGGGNAMFDFSKPVEGFESGYPSGMTGVIAGIDAVVIKGVDASDELVVQAHNASAAQIGTSEHTIPAGAILLVTDCAHAAIFQMTGPKTTGTKTNIVHNKGTGVPGNCEQELGVSCPGKKEYKFKPGASVMRVFANGYYIAPASSGNGNSLWRASLSPDNGAGTTGTAPEELIEGVESMLISYGLDTNTDRSGDVFKHASEISSADWSKVVAVRVSLLLRSQKAKQTTGSQTIVFDRGLAAVPAATTFTDGYLRKVFSETVTVRNRTP
ncbi:MAG: PilW family protein [Betaproteobacteria bacterium]|uniref:PilW family protein n=1 Tax=Candidatus Proximibacter danicus TaxID=2954365 RepID=A0A9D7PSI2_9PROT|nr:PilW family protein [Candidatus Proximibacter danicus]